MKLKLKSSDGKTIVLTQSHEAKPALSFSESYLLSNAFSLACLSELSYAANISDIPKLLRALDLKKRVKVSSDGKGEWNSFLAPYLGKKEYFAEGFAEIKSPTGSKYIIDTQGFCYNDDDVNVIVFRGTAGLKDLAADGYAPKIGFLVGEVHKGFYDNFKAVRDTITGFLDKPENTRCKTILTGHSLGGALATLTAAYLTSKYWDKPCGQVVLYTFGSPRVGDRVWVNHFNTKFKHFRHKRFGDPIPMLPPHHSSMRMPCLPVKILGEAVGSAFGFAAGSAVAPIIGGTAGGEVGRKVVVMGISAIGAGDSELAFIHHGNGILLHQGEFGGDIVQTDLPAEMVPLDGRYFNSKEVLLAKEVVGIVYEFRTLVKPHSMAGYCAELAHLLRKAIRAYDKDPGSWLKMHQDISRTCKHAIVELRKARLREASELEPKPIGQSSTATPDSRKSIRPDEKRALYDDLIANAMATMRHADNEVSIWSRPGMKQNLLALIIAGETSNAIEKEFDFHESSKEPTPDKAGSVELQGIPPI